MHSKRKICGTESLDHPRGLVATHAGALKFARSIMPADLKRAGFVPSVFAGDRGWRINYSWGRQS